MEGKREYRSALRVNAGINQPPSINPAVLSRSARKKRKRYSEDEYVEAILAGNRTILSQAITLVESSLPEHYDTGTGNYRKMSSPQRGINQNRNYRGSRGREKHIH